MADLMLCGRAASFKELTEGEYLKALAQRDRVRASISAKYPGVLEDAEGVHPNKSQADGEYTLLGIRLPLLQAAWAGEGEPPTEAEIMVEPRRAVLAACYAAKTANPDLFELPSPPPPPFTGR